MWFSSLLASWKSTHSRRRQSTASTRSFRPRLEALEERWAPATLNVTSNLDNNTIGTLRYEVSVANASSTPDTIDILTTQPIVLTKGQLTLSASMTIEATGGTATISAGGASSVFYCYDAGKITLSNLNITDGAATKGGGIYDFGTPITLTNCTLSNNSATYGGGIYTGGAPDNKAGLALIDCTLSNNSATYGGGVYMAVGCGPVSLETCTVIDNSAKIIGGGIDDAAGYFGGALDLDGVVFRGNSPNNI
jgi:predicted outer membrane repeat protein